VYASTNVSQRLRQEAESCSQDSEVCSDASYSSSSQSGHLASRQIREYDPSPPSPTSTVHKVVANKVIMAASVKTVL